VRVLGIAGALSPSQMDIRKASISTHNQYVVVRVGTTDDFATPAPERVTWRQLYCQLARKTFAFHFMLERTPRCDEGNI